MAIYLDKDGYGLERKGRGMRGRWRSLIVRAVVAAVIAWILATAPLPRLAPRTWLAQIQIAIVVFLLICYIGKLMIDTFFYNHYKS